MSGSVADRKRLLTITAGDLRNNNLCVSQHLDFFPPDIVGPPRLDEPLNGRAVHIRLEGLNETIETDIGSDAKTGKPRRQFRRRSWVGRFFEKHKVQEGDVLALERRGRRKYRLYVFETVAEHQHDSPPRLDKLPANGGRTVWSFFTGAGGLDLGFEAAGLAPSLAVETDKDCRATLRHNRPDVLLADIPRVKPGDITGISGRDLRLLSGEEGDIFLLIGGPPCQSFSTGGKRAALSDPRGNLIYHYLRLIDEIRPQYFVLENVANLLTAAIHHRPIAKRPGQHWSLKRYEHRPPKSDDGNDPLNEDEMSGSAVRRVIGDIQKLGYGISLGVLNAADFGCAQKRLRLFIVGCRDGEAPQMPSPTHFDPLSGQEPSYRTLRDMIWDLQDDPGPHSIYTEDMAHFFDLVPEGGNWRELPEAMKPLALGNSFSAGGGKTGFFRRLAWDRPAPTIIGRANRKGSAICHPSETRPLSVIECARVQGFPDNWMFSGSMSSRYLQVGNAVPIHLGAAVGASIGDSVHCHTMTQNVSIECQLKAAVKKLRAAARNHKAHARMFQDSSSSLF